MQILFYSVYLHECHLLLFILFQFYWNHLTGQMSETDYHEKGAVIYIPNSGAFGPPSSNIFSSLYEPKDEKSLQFVYFATIFPFRFLAGSCLSSRHRLVRA